MNHKWSTTYFNLFIKLEIIDYPQSKNADY